MLSTNNQNPSTLDLRTDEDDGLRLSSRSRSSIERLEEHEGRDKNGAAVLVGEIDRGCIGGDGEKLNRGAGVMIPFRLGDFDMCFTLIAPGSCRGNLEGYFITCIVLSCSTIVLMVGLPDGSFCRHL